MRDEPPTSTTREGESAVSARLRSASPWLAFGVATVIAGGLVAAVVAHDPSEVAVWASAYLVLVAGVGQIGLALGRTLLAARAPASGAVARDFVVFALGNAGVVAGTLFDVVWLVDVGGALLVVALALMVWSVRGASGTASYGTSGWRVGLLWTYRVLVVVLLVSIPVGLVLARR